MNNLLKPFMKESKSYTAKTAVKKKFRSRLREHLLYYQLSTVNDLIDKKSNNISKVEKLKNKELDNKDWVTYQITKTFQPENSFLFDGNIYVLVNQDTLSAADTYVSAVKELKLATVVGTNTQGWGNLYIQPVLFALPNSGLMFQMDVELAYNADNKETTIYGTMPDVFIEESTYPTSYPKSYEHSSLMKDKLISWVLYQESLLYIE
jgi:C-terminal processing protease CtpA/Prc